MFSLILATSTSFQTSALLGLLNKADELYDCRRAFHAVSASVSTA